MIAVQFLEGSAHIVAVCAALVAIVAVIEKVFSPIGRLLRRWVTAPLEHQLADHIVYVRHHLGPNGDTPAIHTRLADLEADVRELGGRHV